MARLVGMSARIESAVFSSDGKRLAVTGNLSAMAARVLVASLLKHGTEYDKVTPSTQQARNNISSFINNFPYNVFELYHTGCALVTAGVPSPTHDLLVKSGWTVRTSDAEESGP